MNSTTSMEPKTDTDFNDENDDDALSFRDFQMYDQTATSSNRSSPKVSSGQDLFEFFPNLSNPIEHTGDISLFGSSSLRLPERRTDHVIPMRSVSNRDLGSPRHHVKLSKKVKTTALTSKSKRRMFLLGSVKFMPEMEMSSIRERQGRLTPSKMFPVSEGDGDRKTVAGKNQMMTCRARLNSVFERSIACLRP